MRFGYLVLFALFLFIPLDSAIPGGGLEVFGKIDLEDSAEPTNAFNEVRLDPTLKAQDFTPLVVVVQSIDPIGTARIDYDKDSDPFGDFALAVKSNTVGDLIVQYEVEHDIFNVATGTFNMMTTLSIELFDRDNDGEVFLKSHIDGDEDGMLVPRVRQNRLTIDEWVTQDDLILGKAVNITTEGTTNLMSGVLMYTGTDATNKMRMLGDFVLSEGDSAFITGRFELSESLVQVEPSTWGEVKDLYH